MDDQRFKSLSPTERDVLRMAADHQNAEIASALGISAETVKSRLAKAKLKLDGMPRGVASRTLRAIEAASPKRVSPDRGLHATTETVAPDATTSEPIVEVETGGNMVREPRARFEGFPSPAALVPSGSRFAELSRQDRLRQIAGATLKLAVTLLIMLAVGEALQRISLIHFRG